MWGQLVVFLHCKEWERELRTLCGASLSCFYMVKNGRESWESCVGPARLVSTQYRMGNRVEKVVWGQPIMFLHSTEWREIDRWESCMRPAHHVSTQYRMGERETDENVVWGQPIMFLHSTEREIESWDHCVKPACCVFTQYRKRERELRSLCEASLSCFYTVQNGRNVSRKLSGACY